MDMKENEARLSSIEATQARTSANLETVSSDLVRLAQVVESLRDSVASSNRTQWNVVGTWVGVVMAIGAAVIAPQMSDLADLRRAASSASQERHVNTVQVSRLEQKVDGYYAEINTQLSRTREEIDWVWDLLHSRFGYRDPHSQRHEPNRRE